MLWIYDNNITCLFARIPRIILKIIKIIQRSLDAAKLRNYVVQNGIQNHLDLCEKTKSSKIALQKSAY